MPACKQDDEFFYVHPDDRTHPIVGFGKCMTPRNKRKPCMSKSEAWIDIVWFLDTPIARASIDMLSERWNWFEEDVRQFLSDLRNAGMIQDGAQ